MPTQTPRTKKQKQAAIRDTIREFQAGELHSGSTTGPKVTSRKQALAISLRKAGVPRKTKAKQKRGA